MSRPVAVTAAAMLQSGFALAVNATSLYCFYLARVAARSQDPRQAGSAEGLILGGEIVGGLALIYIAGAAGLWRERRWGWWLSFLVNVLIVLGILADIFLDHDRDRDNWVLLAFFAVPIVFFMVPAVRRHYLASPRNAAGEPNG